MVLNMRRVPSQLELMPTGYGSRKGLKLDVKTWTVRLNYICYLSDYTQ